MEGNCYKQDINSLSHCFVAIDMKSSKGKLKGS